MPARRPRRPSSLVPPPGNPFAGAGVARLGEDFTDRAEERKAIAKALRTPKAHLLVVGPRRMGKTSLLRAVQDDLQRAGHPVIYLDLWSSSTVEDVTTRLAQEAVRVLGRTWRELPMALARRLELTLEPSRLADGTLVPVPSLKLRHAPAAQQRQRLVDALDTLDTQARAAGAHVGVMLDEFQLIEVVGRDATDGDQVSAIRQLRSAIQHHTNTTYVLAGSDRTLIDRLSDAKHGPLHNLARRYEIGPIPTDHLAAWIEDRMGRVGRKPARGLGAAIIHATGPRTRDVRTLAETLTDRAVSGGKVTPDDVEPAMLAVVQERRPHYEQGWRELTVLQQNLLRAIAAGEPRLTTHDVRERFSLGESSAATKAVSALVDRGILAREGKRAVFDDPFFRAFVIVAALPDIGLQLPASFTPSR
jgi:uncharacterized protein